MGISGISAGTNRSCLITLERPVLPPAPTPDADSTNVVHVDGNIDPIRDIDTINLELIFADIETVNKRLDKARKMLKADKKYQQEIDLLEKIKEVLESGGVVLQETRRWDDEAGEGYAMRAKEEANDYR